MAKTSKSLSELDANQVLQAAHNDVDATIGVSGFVNGKVGRKVAMAISTTSIANDTETYTFSESGTTLYAIKVIYTTGDRDVFLSAERIS